MISTLDNALLGVVPSPHLTPDHDDNEELEAIIITNQQHLHELTAVADQSYLYNLTAIADQTFLQNMNLNTDFNQVHPIYTREDCRVLKAHMNNRNENEHVIIKMIPTNGPNEGNNNEFNILPKLQHTNIIHLIGTGAANSENFVVLPYLSGGTLHEKLKENRKPYALIPLYFLYKPTFTYRRVLQLAKTIAQALHYLHVLARPGACFIHRSKFLLVDCIIHKLNIFIIIHLYIYYIKLEAR
jgi:serine/threonine protein kinase